jgi:hypothetical protein
MIRRILMSGTTAGVLILLFADPLLSQKTFGVQDYAGDWVRSNQAQNFIVYLSIRAHSGQEISVHSWGRCKRKPEDGGTRADCEDWGSARIQLAPSGTASLFQPVLKELWNMSLSDNGRRLWVRLPNSNIEWTRNPGVDLVRQSPPSTPPATCSITGTLSGPLEGLSYPDHPGPPTKVQLTHMRLITPEGKQLSVVEVRNGRFTFSNLRPGAVYRVVPEFFRSEPRHRDVSCRPNQKHRVDFRIIGALPQG